MLLLVFLSGTLFGHGRLSEQTRRAQRGVEVLQHSYVDRAGLYRTTGWWNAANAITVLTDYMRATGSKQYLPVLAHTFDRAQIVIPKSEQENDLAEMTGAPGFLNRYYDDEGWWALAWIDAFDLTGEPHYLAMARSIFADMAGGWDATCGGGIWWSKDRTYKNAIANELFFSVAAHLAARTEGSEYKDWAQREWRWFQASSMINSDGLVNDGLTIDKATSACSNNGKTTWTYNQGVLVGALAEWSKAAGEQTQLGKAQQLAAAAMARLTDRNGVLHESCEPKCGGDGVQFKGIFVRNLAALDTRAPEKRWKRFIQTNANSIWKADRMPDNRFGVVWTGPVTEADAGAQASALDALVAAAALSNKR